MPVRPHCPPVRRTPACGAVVSPGHWELQRARRIAAPGGSTKGTAMLTADRSNPACDSKLGGNSGHPLNLIPFFGRIKPFPGRGIVYTLIWNTIFATVFAAFWIIFDPHVHLMRVLWVN